MSHENSSCESVCRVSNRAHRGYDSANEGLDGAVAALIITCRGCKSACRGRYSASRGCERDIKTGRV